MGKRNFKKGFIIGIAIMALVAMLSTIFVKNSGLISSFVNKNQDVIENYGIDNAGYKAIIKTENGNYEIDANELILKASELLGKGYSQGDATNDWNGKGLSKSPWSAVIQSSDVKDASNITSVDCSGLVYWTLASIAKEKGWDFGTQFAKVGDANGSTSNITSGFAVNNPVPADTTHWLEYYSSSVSRYFRETGINPTGLPATYTIDGNGNVVWGADLKIRDKSINVLKANQIVKDDLRYYEYIENDGSANGVKKLLPPGTIVVANTKSDANDAKNLDDHAWICIGDLGTTDAEVAKQKLIEMGVDASLLEVGNTITSMSNTCTYWRIESAGGKGVYINNGDPANEMTYAEIVTVNGKQTRKLKAIGPIWAFQVANTGSEYKLSIDKIDENNNKISLNKNIFDAKLNGTTINGQLANNDQGKIEYDPIKFSSSDVVSDKKKEDIILIRENNDLSDKYETYKKLIKLTITKTNENGKLIGKVTKVEIGNDESTLVDQGQVRQNSNNSYDNGNVVIDLSENNINVKIKNKKLQGQYSLNLYKKDSKGNNKNGAKFNAQFATKSGTAFVNNWSNLKLNGSTSAFSTDSIKIDPSAVTSGLIDVIQLEETQSPNGYEKLDKKIVLQITKAQKDGNLLIDSIGISVFNKQDSITADMLGNGTYTVNSTNRIYTDNDNHFKVELSNDNATINVSVENRTIDLALKKTITKVNGTVVDTNNGFNTGRVISQDLINQYNLDGNFVDIKGLERTTNANYMLNKKPVAVNIGDEVEYAIKIFNEGETRAKASKINDYIPQGLTVTEVTYRGNSIPFNVTKGVLSISLDGTDNFIEPFNGSTLSFDQVFVKCVVQNDAKGVLTNIAEITEYQTPTGIITTDIDSTSDNWKAPNGENKLSNDKDSDQWRNYGHDDIIDTWSMDNFVQDTGVNGFKGDDDDFDKIIVNTLDLALKKVITEVATIDESGVTLDLKTIKRPEIDDYSWVDKTPLNNGKTDALYNMNKTPILVKKGNKITYRLYIFNEGKTDAKALNIDDFIPVGLQVKNVYYKDNGHMDVVDVNDFDNQANQNKNFYSYVEDKGCLYVHLGADNASLIPAFNGTTLSNDYITVECIVKDTAEGILTNMAEIETYATERVEMNKDIDSSSDNWKSPNGDFKASSDKSTPEWRNYVKGTGKLDDDYHTTFVGKQFDDEKGQEDDDDFEKVKVIEDYKVALQKISEQDETQTIENIGFKVKYNTENEKTVYTNAQGNVDLGYKDIFYNVNTNEEDIFSIQEISIPDGVTYNKINRNFELRLKKTRTANSADIISQYAFVVSGTSTKKIRYKSLSEETIMLADDEAGNNVYVRVKYNADDRKFTITIPNNVKSSDYELQLVKVKNKINETDAETPIRGIKFGISSRQDVPETDVDGKINFGTYPITQDNYETNDIYTVTEITDTTSRYYQLKDSLTIGVKKNLDKQRALYYVDEISLNGSEYSKGPITQEVALKNSNKKVTVTLTLEGNVITLKVPNIEKEGKYSLYIEKQDSNGNVLDNVRTGFSLGTSADEELTNSGKVVLVSEKAISAETLGDDEYTIIETKAPEGYVKLAKTINIKVHKSDNGEKYIADSVTATVEGSSNSLVVEKGKFNTIQNVELIDGSKVDIIVDMQEEDTIKITVKNNKIKGWYKFEIYKYAIENGSEIKVPNMSFWIKKGIRRSKITTNSDGIASFGPTNGIAISNVTTDTYEIDEIIDDNSKFIPLTSTIKVIATTGLNSDSSKYVLQDANFENGTKTTTGTLANGKTVTINMSVNQNPNGINTIRINVENPIIRGKYIVDLAKVVLKENGTENLEGVTFKVSENDGETVDRTTNTNGLVTIADKNISYETLNDDTYKITEIVMTNQNKYIKLARPLTLKISKGKNTTGVAGTENAPGTKFVVTKYMITDTGSGRFVQKEYTDNTDAVLANVALEDGTTVDIIAKLTEETDNQTNEKIQRLTVTVPNKEVEGNYSVRIRKIDSKSQGINNTEFKVESTVNGEVQSVINPKSINNGFVDVKTVELNAEKLNTVDTYKISEIKVYKNATSTEEEIGYAKLVNPLTLSVSKNRIGNSFGISNFSLAEEGKQAVNAENGVVTLENVDLQYGLKATVTAKLTGNEITITIPNKELSGNYSLNLVKTKSDFETKLKGFAFRYTGNESGQKTDDNGEIVIVDNKKITKDTLNNDVYEISEIEDTKNIYAELAEKLTVTVEKGLENGAFVVKKVTISSLNNSQSITTGSGVNTVELDGIQTVVANKTAKAKLSFDEDTQKISFMISNPELEGEYSLKLKKVDDKNSSTVLSGVQFNGIKKEFSVDDGYVVTKAMTKMTQSDGFAYFAGDDPNTSGIVEEKEKITSKYPETWEFRELATLPNYRLLNGVRIQLSINKKVSEDGRKYILDDKNIELSVVRNEETDEARAFQKWLREKMQIRVAPNGEEIIITVPNEKLTDYKFKLVKTDENGDELEGSRFTVVEPDGTTALNNELLPNDSYYLKEFRNVRTNETYKFVVTENSSPDTYDNVIDGFNLEVEAKINDNGKIDIANSKLNVIPVNDNYDTDKFIEINRLIQNNKIGISVDDATNTIILTVQNTKVTADYSLKLLKTEIGTTKPLAGAEFSVTKNGNLFTLFSTSSKGPKLIDNPEKVKANSSIEYIIQEGRAPGNYEIKVSKAKVVVNVSDNGTVSASITEVLPNGATDWRSYDEAIYANIVKLVRTPGTNEYTIQWSNSSELVFYLYKEGYDKQLIGKDYSSNLIENSLPPLAGVNVSIAQDNQAPETATTGASAEVKVRKDVRANAEYTYTVEELASVTDYNNDFEGVKLKIHLRTDSSANLIEANQDLKSQYSYFEIIDETGTKTKKQIADMESKLLLKVDSATNSAKFYMVNTKQPGTGKYQIKLIKMDDKKVKGLANAEFEVKFNDGTNTTQLDSNPDVDGIQNYKSDKSGIININDISFVQGTSTEQIHSFTIKEITAPDGYVGLGDREINVRVDLTDKMTSRDIRPDDVTLSGIENTEIEYEVNSDGLIYIIVPNESKTFKVTLRKIDTNGNLISAELDSNGVLQGSKLQMKNTNAINNVIVSDRTIFGGEYTFTENIANHSTNSYIYNISEKEAKIGYGNIFKDYDISLFVKLDENENVKDINPNDLTDDSTTHFSISRARYDTDVTIDEAKEKVRLSVVDDDDGQRRVIIDLINPIEYKLRLRKTDTSRKEKALDKATLIASIYKNGELVEKTNINKDEEATEKISESETEFISINEGETQTWVVDEIKVDKPFTNILEGDKKLYINAKVENQEILVDYEVKDIVDGNEITYGRDNNIYRFINVNVVKENGDNVLVVQIKNPIGLNFITIKSDINNNPINSAVIDVNGVTNVQGADINSRIDISENNLAVGDEKIFTISELRADDPYVNILGNNKIFIKAKVTEDNNVDLSGYGYIDEQGRTHNGTFGPFEDFVKIDKGPFIRNLTTGIPTKVIRILNPVKYKVRVNKVDENGNRLVNADFEIEDQDGNIISNNGSDYAEFTGMTTNKNVHEYIKIRENDSAFGYNNDLKDKEILFKVRSKVSEDALKVELQEQYLIQRNYYDEDSENYIDKLYLNWDEISDLVSYEIIEENGIPVINITMKNTTDYSLNLLKLTTNEVPYMNAKLELYEVNSENGEKTFIKNNMITLRTQAYLNYNDIHVLPNKQYTYAIKEIYTLNPHVNILDDDKEIRLNVKLEKNETTGELSLVHNYNIVDKDGNILRDDPAYDFINFDVVQDQETGKYTLQVNIKNPVKFKMDFLKTDLNGNEIPGKATIKINGKENNGSANETYSYLKIGDTVQFTIEETTANAPFTNVLGNNKIILVARVMENENISVVESKYIDLSGETPMVNDTIPDEVAKYFKYQVVSGNEGIDTLKLELENPISYKVRINKEDMKGNALQGADIIATYNGRKYSNQGTDYIEIPIENQGAGDIAKINIKEIKSKDNYKNIFEGKSINLEFKVEDNYTVSCIKQEETYRNQTTSLIRDRYFEVNIDNLENNQSEITANVVMRNPVEYKLKLVKTDLSGNQISGQDLSLKITKNDGVSNSYYYNGGQSTIDIEEYNLAVNDVRTYTIEEISTITPFVNRLENKKAIIQVRVGEDGELIVSEPVIKDDDGNNVLNNMISVDDTLKTGDGTRLIEVKLENPMRYKFKLNKTKTPYHDNEPQPLEGASILVNDVANENGSSEINMTIDDVKIGDRKTFTIKEISAPAPYDNILEDKEILVTTEMGSNRKVNIVSQILRDTKTGESVIITDEVKDKYRFDIDIANEDGFDTIKVNIQNPIKFKVKLVKKDATGVTELSGTDIELYCDGKEVVSNRDTGSAVLEYTKNDAVPGGSYVFTIKENQSVSPNQNTLEGKELVIPVNILENNSLNTVLFEVTNADNSTDFAPKYVSKRVETIDGIQTIIIELENPVDFDVDLVKKAGGIDFLQQAQFQVYREAVDQEGLDGKVFDRFVTDRNITRVSEVTEHNMKAGKYTYYITEQKAPNARYINVLDGKYIKVNVEISGTGKMTIMNNNWEEDENYYEIYDGDISDRKATDSIVDRTDLIYSNISTAVVIDNKDNKNILQCTVSNPVRYRVEVNKLDSVGQGLDGAEFELVSEVINNQNAEKTDLTKATGVSNITEDGEVIGTTENGGKISYEETFVNAGTYEYTIKEVETPGSQYVNPIDGYTVHFKVKVDQKGNLELQNYDNNKVCFIEKDGVEAKQELYRYVYLDVTNREIIANVLIEVENPVTYTVALRKSIYGQENILLGGAQFRIESSIMKTQQSEYREPAREIGVTDVDTNGVILGTTNENGIIKFNETMVDSGIYEYWISEIHSGNENIINALGDKNIKINVKVDSDGSIHTVSDDGQIIDGKYYLYDHEKENQISFNSTSIDEMIDVSVNSENAVNVLNINIKDPQAFDLNLMKTDKDTMENMNDVKFQVKAYEEKEDNTIEEIPIKLADNIVEVYDASELVTGRIRYLDGMISIKDILIEKPGTYYYEFIETTPTEPIIYKDKAENVKVKVEIAVQEIDGQNQYVITNMEVVQGNNYIIDENTNYASHIVNVNISNERIKGKYDLVITKLEELLGGPVQGAEFTVKAFKENSEFEVEDEINLYESTDDVNSMNSIIPTEFTIDSDDGVLSIPNIRIDKPETYIIEIKETKAPETYTILRDAIRIKVTTGIEGENDDAKYVVKSAELDGKDNDGLVGVTRTNDKIDVSITNNQFDLALRKYISSIDGEDVTRWTEPQIDTSKLITGESTTAEYYNDKKPLRVFAGSEIIYTLRIYNEGQIDGYANNIVDHLPEGLEFLPEDNFNILRRWKFVKDDPTQRTIETDYLSKDIAKDERGLIKAFNSETGEISFVEVQVKCKIKDNVKARTYITNIAEITEYEGKDRPNVIDRDNFELVDVPNDEDLAEYKKDEISKQNVPGKDDDGKSNKYIPGQEDDDDFEKVVVEEFDLALRKFITQINDKEVTTRIPKFKIDENGKYIYEHDKDALVVAHDNLVEYTIRIFNEGTISGYANLVKDDIPEGLVFVPDSETNKQYRWVMLDENENETSDVTKAVFVRTDYLSMEQGAERMGENGSTSDSTENPNLIQAFDSSTMTEPDSKDLKIVFRVNVPVRRDDVIINHAQISDDTDEFGKPVKDKDSTTDEWIDGEDDQDYEPIKVKYFDLALYKWVSTAIVIEDGNTTEYPSNHSQSDKSNVVNVSIAKSKVDAVVVKFRYVIKVENQGNLEGYAKEIKDHIPAGLKFVAEDNTEYGWVLQPDGTITTDYLKDTLLKEGETAEVPVTLTWINGSENLGEKVNYAEISKDYNEYGSPDIDSSTDNFTGTPKEDDEDGDVVRLNIRTGISAPVGVIVAIAVMVIIAGGVVGIKKFVIE